MDNKYLPAILEPQLGAEGFRQALWEAMLAKHAAHGECTRARIDAFLPCLSAVAQPVCLKHCTAALWRIHPPTEVFNLDDVHAARANRTYSAIERQ